MLVAGVHLSAAASLLYFFGITVAANQVFSGERWTACVGLFVMYTGLILVGYYLNWAAFPSYYGFTSAEIAGTDDSYFYSLTAAYLPSDFPVRPTYYLRDHPYAILMRAVTPFPVNHPLDILFFNAIGATFIPIFARMLASELTGDRKVARMTFWMVAFGPFLWTNSLVLVRDGWTAALFAGSIAFFLRQQFVRASALAALLFFLRIASGLQLLLVVGMLTLGVLIQLESTRRKVLYLSITAVGGVVALVVVYPMLLARVQSMGGDSLLGLLVRENFIEALQSMDPGTFIATINTQPLYIRLPAALLFFLTFPFINPSDILVQGRVIWRSILLNVYSAVFIVYFKFLVQGILHAIREGSMAMRMFTLAILLTVLFLSQASMQLRHKTMIMPALYLISAFGYHHASDLEKQIGWVALFGILVLNVLKFLLGI
jgi:hypothetical protein